MSKPVRHGLPIIAALVAAAHVGPVLPEPWRAAVVLASLAWFAWLVCRPTLARLGITRPLERAGATGVWVAWVVGLGGILAFAVAAQPTGIGTMLAIDAVAGTSLAAATLAARCRPPRTARGGEAQGRRAAATMLLALLAGGGGIALAVRSSPDRTPTRYVSWGVASPGAGAELVGAGAQAVRLRIENRSERALRLAIVGSVDGVTVGSRVATVQPGAPVDLSLRLALPERPCTERVALRLEGAPAQLAPHELLLWYRGAAEPSRLCASPPPRSDG